MSDQKVLITGINGFVGGYLSENLRADGHPVFGCGMDAPGPDGVDYTVVDVRDAEAMASWVQRVRPDLVYHLAGISSVSLSMREPELTHAVNVGGTDNLLRAVSQYAPQSRIIIVSSGEVYAAQATPCKESDPLDPDANPYAASRVEQEALALSYKGLNLTISRSFNHTGPGQVDSFVAASFAHQVADIEAGKQAPVLNVGNLDVTRDFSDVRDVVTAYRLLADQGDAHEIYNIGSGQGVTIEWILNTLVAQADSAIEVRPDPARMRKSDKPVLIADVDKFKSLTGWRPQYTLRQTFTDMLEYWRQKTRP